MSGVIVVGVDGSETARKAAETARDLAAALGATLHVVSAFDNGRSEVFGSGSNKWLVSDGDKAEHLTRTMADTLGGSIEITHAASHPQGGPPDRSRQPEDAGHPTRPGQRGQQCGPQRTL